MKTQYYAASSLDGFIAAPDHSLDWLMQFGSPENLGYNDFIRDVGAAVMGSATYEWLLRQHVQPEGGPPQPRGADRDEQASAGHAGGKGELRHDQRELLVDRETLRVHRNAVGFQREAVAARDQPRPPDRAGEAVR